MSYKIDPSAVQILKDKYTGMKIYMVVDGEISVRNNEVNANSVLIEYKGNDWGVVFYQDKYELVSFGAMVDKVEGIYGSLIGAVDSIAARV